jgi:uncharacterized membrane protein
MIESKSKSFTLILLLASLMLLLVNNRCRHDGLNVADLNKVCYDRDIAPIFQNSCSTTGCHDRQGGESEYVFSDYNSVMKTITPFDAQKSKAYKAITGKGFVQLMPPSGALTEQERILIRVWIDQGAEHTTCLAIGSHIVLSSPTIESKKLN